MKTAIHKLINWVKSHKLTALLIAILIYIFLSNSSLPSFTSHVGYAPEMDYGRGYNPMEEGNMMYDAAPMTGGGKKALMSPSSQNTSSQPSAADRKVVTESQMSLLVKDVRETTDKIQAEVERIGGHVVNTFVHSPEEGATGYITVRVPVETLKETLDTLRDYSVKVVSENISGYDITDRYMDVESRLATLEKTKGMFEEILTKATDVDEILRVQQRILSVQDQIDSLKGQLKYMDATTSTTLITINLSTDELALPYSPGAPWRPSVVFKYAIRSLIINLRSLGSAAIWVGVYAVIWVPALIISLVIRKVVKKRKEKAGQGK